jgi:large subunit ribosomal protein L24
MNKMKLKKGDLVAVIAGKDKGKQGKITEVVLKDNKVIVEGVNMVKKHSKASQTTAAGIISKQLPIHASNVMLIDPKSGKPTRIGKKAEKNGSFVRFAKNSGTVITETKTATK